MDAPVDWRALAARVVVEACAAHPQDVALVIGDAAVADALAMRCTVHRATDLALPPAGTTMVLLHWWLRRFPPSRQRALLAEAARLLPARGLVVIGDLMWSFPVDQIDAPEQYGDALEHVASAVDLESWARAAGFLPDLHRFSPGVGVLVGVRT